MSGPQGGQRATEATSTGEAPAPTKLKAVKRTVLTEGQLAAASVTREAAARRSGKVTDPIVLDEKLEEDWHLDAMQSTPKAAESLAGLYRVKHGNLCISADGRMATTKDKDGVARTPSGDNHVIVRGPRMVDGVMQPGRKVKLTAEEARLFLEQDLVERLD